MKKILISSIFAITFFLTVVTAVLISDQGTTVKNSTGYLLSSGNLTIEIYDSSTGGTVIANQTFADAIINGSWNLNMNASLEYGKSYWKNYLINNEEVSFDGSDRLEFQSSLGLINNVSYINFSLISSCSAGSSIRLIYANGTVICETDGAVNTSYYLATNPFSFYNSTLWNNPYTYWNSTFATFNKTYADTIYYPYLSNPFGYLNSSTETLWNANYSTFLTHISWDKVINGTIWGQITNGTMASWANVANGTMLSQATYNTNYSTLYLATNPYSFYNATTLPAGNEALWNANLTANNATWNKDLWNTTEQIWAVVYNGTFYADNAHNYTNKTLLNQFENNAGFIAWDKVINGTIWGQITNGTMASWANVANGTMLSQATYNTNYSTLYLATNTYSFYNATTLPAGNEALWNANLTANNATWNSINNATYNDAWQYVRNSTFYLATNPYSFYNATTLPAGNEALWNANLTANNATWNKDLWNTTEQIWAVVYNGTFYADNAHNYTNKTLLSQFENNAGFISWDKVINGTVYLSTNSYSFYNSTSWNNPYNYTNFTKLSDYTNDLTFYVDNSHSYWNSTFATFNKTYADTIYYPYLSNPFGYLNSSTETLWNANYSAFLTHISWDKVINGTVYLSTNSYSFYNSTNWNNPYTYWNSTFAGFNKTYADTIYYPYLSNPFGYLNSSTETLWNANYSTFLTHISWDKVINGTIWGQITNGTMASWANVANGTMLSQATYNANYSTLYLATNPYSFYNATTLPAGNEALWNANLTANNATWNKDLWNTTEQIWAVVYNGTFYADNAHNYTNKTLLSQFENNAGFISWDKVINGTIWGQITNGTMASWANVANGTMLSQATYNTNYSTLYLATNPYSFYNATTLPASTETNWNANLTANNATWNKDLWNTTEQIWAVVYNGTFYADNAHNYTNKTLLSQFENNAGFISWDKVINGTVYLSTNSYSFYNSTSWNNPYNYTNFTKLSDYTNDLTFYVDNTHGYWNSTFATFNKTYADTLYATIAEPLWTGNQSSYYLITNPFGFYNSTTLPASTETNWNANYTNIPKLDALNIFTSNQTVEGLVFEQDTTNHLIYDNATCIFITGDTSVLEIC